MIVSETIKSNFAEITITVWLKEVEAFWSLLNEKFAESTSGEIRNVAERNTCGWADAADKPT